MQGQQTQDASRNDGLPDAMARLLADDPIEAAHAWQGLEPAEPDPPAAAAATADWLLAAAPAADPLGNRVLAQLPDGSPEVYGRLGAAVLAAWTDGRLRDQWRRDPGGMAATFGLPSAVSRLARVVGPADGRLPRQDAITIPLPPATAAYSSRSAALRDLAATDFGWLLAGVPGGAEALGLALPDGAASAVDPRQPPLAWLTDRLRPRTFLLAGSMVCLLVAIGLSVSVGGDGGLTGAVLGPEATWRLPAAALSLLLGLVLFVLAERRD